VGCPFSSQCIYYDYNNCITFTYDWGGSWPYATCDIGYNYADLDTNGCVTAVNACTPSDVRLKQSIETLKDSLKNLMELEVVEYDWNKNLSKGEYEFFEKNKK